LIKYRHKIPMHLKLACAQRSHDH